jgi:hypothetical protein
LEHSNAFDCVSQKENILLNTENKRIMGVLTGLADYRHQNPNRNEERTKMKQQKKLQMDKEKDNEDRQRKLELRKK